MNVSIRTIYRDIQTLQQQGADIDGEPGVGYILRPGFMLPPLMFSEEEIEALVLGGRWVARRGDERLSVAAKNAITKIAAVLPDDLKNILEASTLLAGGENLAFGEVELANIRHAIRVEHKLVIKYLDLKDCETVRTVWPFAIGYFNDVNVLVGWCELREDFRHFRTDRLLSVTSLEEKYPRRRTVLFKEWRDKQKIDLR